MEEKEFCIHLNLTISDQPGQIIAGFAGVVNDLVFDHHRPARRKRGGIGGGRRHGGTSV